MQRIAVIDDDKDIRELIDLLLKNDGYEVILFENGDNILDSIDESIDLVILDIMMPGMNGIEVCKRIREQHRIPVIFLTAKSQEDDVIVGFSAGADDYISKPFYYNDLRIRVKSLLRRYCDYGSKRAGNINATIIAGDLSIDTEHNHVIKDGVELDLTEREYRILKLLLSNPGRIFTIETLFEQVWEETYYYSCSNTVMVHIRNLRKKIEDEPNKPKLIKNVWGKGYKYNEV